MERSGEKVSHLRQDIMDNFLGRDSRPPSLPPWSQSSAEGGEEGEALLLPSHRLMRALRRHSSTETCSNADVGRSATHPARTRATRWPALPSRNLGYTSYPEYASVKRLPRILKATRWNYEPLFWAMHHAPNTTWCLHHAPLSIMKQSFLEQAPKKWSMIQVVNEPSGSLKSINPLL